MKAICVGEYVKGDVAPATYELLEFAGRAGAQAAMVMAGEGNSLPAFDGRLYLAGFKEPESYAPDLHKKMILEAVEREKPDLLVFSHSPYGWDLAHHRYRPHPSQSHV